MIRAWLRELVELLKRFIDATPRNQYEQAIFMALRNILITAFLKPMRRPYGPVVAQAGV